MGTTVTKNGEYTEATHTAYGTVDEAAPIAVDGKRFRPSGITVKYEWRTQFGHNDWGGTRIEVAGPWINEDDEATGTGSGSVRMALNDAPDWAQEFVRANVPTVGLRPLDQDPPQRFAGHPVVGSLELADDPSEHPNKYVVMTRQGGRFNVHVITFNGAEWVGGQGYYDLTWQHAVSDFAERASRFGPRTSRPRAKGGNGYPRNANGYRDAEMDATEEAHDA